MVILVLNVPIIMGKRKSRESDHVQQQCDVWLTAPEKPKNSQKKQRILSLHAVNIIGSRPLTFDPTKSSSNKTKQSQLMSFFKPKTVALQQIPSDKSNEKDNTQSHQMHNKRTNQTQIHDESRISLPLGTTSKSPAKQTGNLENIPAERTMQYGNTVKTSRNLASSPRSTESHVELQSKQYSAVASAPVKYTRLDFSQNDTDTMNSSSQSPQENFGTKYSINSEDENSTLEGLNLSTNFSDQYPQRSAPDLSNIDTCSFEDESALFQKVSKDDFDLADTFEESNVPEINNTCNECYTSLDYTDNRFRDSSFVNNSQNSRIEFSPINTQKLQASFISGNRSTFVSKGVCARNISFNSNVKGLDDFSDVSGQTFSENQVPIESPQRNRVKAQEVKGHTYSRSEVNDLEMSGTGFKRSEDEQRKSCMWKKNSKRTQWLNDFDEGFDRESFGDTQLSKEKSQCESKLSTELEECGEPYLRRTKESGLSNSDLNDSDLLSCSIEQNTLSQCSEFKENMQSTSFPMSLGSDSFRTQDVFRDCFKEKNKNMLDVDSEFTSQLYDDDLELTDCSQKSPSNEQSLPNTFTDFNSMESSHKRVENESQSYFVSTHQSELLPESDRCDLILDTQNKANTDFEHSSEFASQHVGESDSFLRTGAVSDTDDNDNDSQDFDIVLSPQITQDSIGIYRLK